MPKSKPTVIWNLSKDELTELMSVLLEDNMRLVDRLRTVSAKSYRKSRHIRNLLKGLRNRTKNMETSELLYVQQLVKAEQLQLDLEKEQLKIDELTYARNIALKENKKLQEHTRTVNNTKSQVIHRVSDLETTKDTCLENLSSSDYMLLTAVFGWGVLLTVFAGVLWTLLN